MMKFKKYISIFVVILILISGCSGQGKHMNADFYYSYAEISFASTDQTIGSEHRIINADPLNYHAILTKYLEGPQSSEFANPFPTGTKIVSITVDQQIASIVLSDNFSDLTGIELTLACACLSLTTERITGCAQVQLSAEKALLDSKKSITINTNELSFTDSQN